MDIAAGQGKVVFWPTPYDQQVTSSTLALVCKKDWHNRCKFRYVSNFIFKLIMVRFTFMYAKHLSSWTHMAPKTAQNTLNHV